MALKIRFAKPQGWMAWVALLSIAAALMTVTVVLACFSVFGWYYFKYERIVDDRFKQPIFANTAKIYAAPREVRPGQKLTVRLIANELHDAGYSTQGASQASQLGTYSENAQSITINPGPQSYHAQDGATIRIGSSVVQSI